MTPTPPSRWVCSEKCVIPNLYGFLWNTKEDILKNVLSIQINVNGVQNNIECHWLLLNGQKKHRCFSTYCLLWSAEETIYLKRTFKILSTGCRFDGSALCCACSLWKCDCSVRWKTSSLHRIQRTLHIFRTPAVSRPNLSLQVPAAPRQTVCGTVSLASSETIQHLLYIYVFLYRTWWDWLAC